MSGSFENRDVPADGDVIRSKTMVNSEGGLVETTMHGRCGYCGFIFKPNSDIYVCVGGELVCSGCCHLVEDKAFCRTHLHQVTVSKNAMKVLVCIHFGLKEKAARKVSLLSKEQYHDGLQELIAKELCVATGLGLVGNGFKIAGNAPVVMHTLLGFKDPDVRMFVSKLKEVAEWRG